MKKIIIIICLSIFYQLNIKAQAPPINILRYNDNFNYLKSDTIKKHGLEYLKMIDLGQKKAYLSIGGELREQLQYFKNTNFGDVPPTFKETSPTQLWHRAMLHADVSVGKKWRLFTQINSTLRLFNPNPKIEIDENQLGLHQVFVEYHPTKVWQMRVGRQELSYGNNRVLTFREGPNNRLAFDAVIVKYQNPTLRIDAIAASPVFQGTKIGDDKTFQERIFGIYATQKLHTKRLILDYYVMNFASNRIKYNLLSGHENRSTVGLRLFGQLPIWNYDVEASYQVGNFNGSLINALGVSFDTKYRFTKKSKVTFALAGNYISGDNNPNDAQLNTYNLLYSKPSFGLAAPIGAANIINVNPYFTWQATKQFSVLGGVYFLSRASQKDGIYSPAMQQTRPTLPQTLFKSTERKIGNQYVLEFSYIFNQNIMLFADFAYLSAGDFVSETGKGKNITYLSAKVAYKF